MALAFTANHLVRDVNGEVATPDAPGLGIAIDPAGIRHYLLDLEITVQGRRLYATPTI